MLEGPVCVRTSKMGVGTEFNIIPSFLEYLKGHNCKVEGKNVSLKNNT